MDGLSVIICTHNPRREYLSRVLAALAAQSMPRDGWELLLVDNASRELLAEAYDLSWHPAGRHVREDALGVINARCRGIGEARGDLIVFVDDDNVVEPDFLQCAGTIADRYPFLGLFGAGHIEPEYERKPPRAVSSRAALLTVRDVRVARWSNNPSDAETVPWGAGACIRRRVADRYLAFVEQLGVSAVLGRKGMELFSGEDDLFSWVATSMDLGFGLFPQLRIRHLIAARRVGPAHVLKLTRDHAFSSAILHFMLAGARPRRIDGFRYPHLLLHAVRNGWFSARCQWAMSVGEDQAAAFIESKGLRSTHVPAPVPSEPAKCDSAS